VPDADDWGRDDNPCRYDAYARAYPNYRETSQDLVAIALDPAGEGAVDAIVLDLACGTGVTTAEILAVLGPAGRVIGVDQAAAMLAVAASSVADSRASWIHASAESVAHHVSEPVDVVICNSAIWQTDFAATAQAVRTVLKVGGRFAFNVPVGFLHDGDSQPASDRYPALLSEMREIAQRDYGWVPETVAEGKPWQRLSRDWYCRSLTAAGFDVEQVSEVSHQNSAESQRAWLSIPIFTRDRLGGLSYEDRMRVLAKAYDHLGPGRPESAQWMVFVGRAIEPLSGGNRGDG
jgi:ubiquinone/menaquinone biosynthesis C-methylase UbiE